MLSFNSERVVIDGVRYPSYFGHLEQYVGRAGLIHCLNADNNEYKTHSSYDESLAVPSTNPDELMLLDYSAMRVIVLGIAAPKTPEAYKDAVLKLISFELSKDRKRTLKTMSVITLEEGHQLAEDNSLLNRVIQQSISRVDTARAYARDIGETVPKQRPMEYSCFGKGVDTKSIIRAVYDDLGAEVAKQLFDQVHEGPMTLALESELRLLAVNSGYDMTKDIAKFKVKSSDMFFQLIAGYWKRLSTESRSALSTLDRYGIERTTLNSGASKIDSGEPTTEVLATATPESLAEAIEVFSEVNKHLLAISGGKRGFRADQFDGVPICFRTALMMEGERPCDGRAFGAGACPGHSNRERADWIKAVDYLISVCEKDLKYLMRRLPHLKRLCTSLKAGGRVPEVLALPGKNRSLQVLEPEVPPDWLVTDAESSDEEYSPFRAGL